MLSPVSALTPDLFEALFDLSLTGSVLYDPVRDAAGEIVDFAFARLNSAAQRMLALPARPATTYLAQFPAARTNGGFAFHRTTFGADEPGQFEISYQADGYDNYFRVSARRVGEQLLVSFTDTADQPRSAVEVALRNGQAQERNAHAEAERQRGELEQLLAQAPVAMALFRGPDYVIELANEAMATVWGRSLPQVLGQPVFTALPEVQHQGFEELFADVLTHGTPYNLYEVPVTIDRAHTGQPTQGYFNLTHRPQRDVLGRITGIITSAHEVTEHVLARQQVEQLNQELEAHVQHRTQQLADALGTTEQQREQLAVHQGLLSQIMGQVPAAIATLSGPEHRFSFFNDQYQHLVAGRAALGQNVADVLPEIVAQGFMSRLDQVYQTGQPEVGTEVPVVLLQAAAPPRQYYFNFTCQPLTDGPGQVQGILVFAVDVTEQVSSRQQLAALQTEVLAAAQRQVQERESLYQFFTQVPAPVAVLQGPAHHYAYVNPAYARFLPGRALLGQPYAEAVPEGKQDGVTQLLDEVYASGEPLVGYEQPLALVQPDGLPATFYFNFTYQPYREGGQTVGMFVLAQEVTEQVRAKQQRETQARQFQELYGQAPMAICILRGPEFIVELANPALLRIWGLTAEEALGRPRLELIPEISRARVRQVLETPYRTRQLHQVQEYPVVLGHTQPEVGYFNFIYQPLLDEQGEVIALTGVGIEVTAQVLARQAIEASAQQLRLITDALPVLIGYLDQEERYQFANEAYRTWFHQDPAALLGQSAREVVGEAAYAVVRQNLARALAGERLEFESYMDYRADFARYIRTTFIPDVREGEVVGIHTLITDMTDSVAARQQVQAARTEAERQRRQWEQLFRRAPAAICIFNGPEWVYEFVNPGYQAMFPGRALLGKRLVDALPEVAGQPLMQILRRVYDTGETFEGHEVLVPLARTAEGPVEDIYFDLTYIARYNDASEIDGFVTYAYDVTQQVMARREREQRQQELQQVFEQAPVGVYVMRMPNYVLDVVNEPMARILGRPVAMLHGRPLFDVVPEATSQGALLDQVWRTQQPLYLSEQPFHMAYHQPGEVSYFSYVYQPLLDPQGQMTALVCVAQEVTTQVRARQQVQELNNELITINEELQASNQQLTRTNVDLDTFIYTASHDLKAPITNIEGILLALREQLPPAALQDELVAQLLEMLQSTVTRFRTTITQLTDISKLQLAHAGPTEPVQLAAVVEDVRLDLAPFIQAAATHLQVEVAPELVVSFSPANLRSVLYNLLSNAIKYRAPDRPSVVRVHAERTEQAVVLTVQDNGLGLTAGQQRQLFGLFQRLHTHVEGTGVGLYIIKRLVENAGGTIAVHSQVGEGTTFTVAFPVAK